MLVVTCILLLSGLLHTLCFSFNRGSYVALVTPMKSDRSIDFNSFEKLLKWHVSEGSDGIVVLGTTGEGSLISRDERKHVIDKAVTIVDGKIPVVVGTGSINIDDVIKNCEQAKELGADATLIITPYYVKPPQRALVEHFRMIADAVDIPHILYNCPGRTGVDMKPETIAQCSQHKNIVGVKDATGDLSRIQLIRSLTNHKKNFLIFRFHLNCSGEDDSGCEFVRMGGDGVISVTANVAPKPMSRMLKLSREGKSQDAEEINQLLMPLHKRLFLESNPIPVKKALYLMSMIENGIRPPLSELSAEYLPSLVESLEHANIQIRS